MTTQRKHKRSTAPYPTSGGGWLHQNGQLVRESAPAAATDAAQPAPEAEAAKAGGRRRAASTEE